ncbi:hypothetical protein BKA56DRAFT_638630 [Ilyonectria sp. MPI-CAGE-AT-0026]|nr:hypothetical protein BKA56DRAFT_638630 [Ilyonectria sp. MPI-CAGE-AT-0026]
MFVLHTNIATREVFSRPLAKRGSSILPGLWADPNIAVINRTYYLYVTTDSFKGWDLISWTRGKEPFLAPGFAAREGKFFFYYSNTNPSVAEGYKSIRAQSKAIIQGTKDKEIVSNQTINPINRYILIVAESKNYRVGYATASNPIGSRIYCGVILILGTGYDSVLNYIVYHRFLIPGGGGFRREITIDKLYID